MAKLGSEKRPVVVRVQNETSAGGIISICKKYGWHFIVGIEPDKPEDTCDVEQLLNVQIIKANTTIKKLSKENEKLRKRIQQLEAMSDRKNSKKSSR